MRGAASLLLFVQSGYFRGSAASTALASTALASILASRFTRRARRRPLAARSHK